MPVSQSHQHPTPAPDRKKQIGVVEAKAQVLRMVGEVWQRSQAVPAAALEAAVDHAMTTLRQQTPAANRKR